MINSFYLDVVPINDHKRALLATLGNYVIGGDSCKQSDPVTVGRHPQEISMHQSAERQTGSKHQKQ